MPGTRRDGLLRTLTWLLMASGAYWFVVAVRASRPGSEGSALTGVILAGLSVTLACGLGVARARARRRTQDRSTSQATQMLLVAQLGRQDDATLERIARTGGPAGEAATMILQGRHLGNPAGRRSHPPEH